MDAMVMKTTTAPAQHDPLADFDGHVPDRSKLDAELRIVDEAEFLTRLEPRTVEPVSTGRWESRNRHRPGEPTEHGMRMKLLDLQREQRAERAAGIRRRP